MGNKLNNFCACSHVLKIYAIIFQIISCVRSRGDTLEWCKNQCREYGQQALSALGYFPTSDAKSALINIVQATTVFKRIKT